MKENKLAELSMEFSIQILQLVKELKENEKRSFLTKSVAPGPRSAPTCLKPITRKEKKTSFQNLKSR